MATPGPWDKVGRGPVWNRKYLTRRDWALLDDVSKTVGIPLKVMQGSWSGSVSASAGTHSKTGAIDISTKGMSLTKILQVVEEFRERNGAAWYRAPEYGWPKKAGPEHIHVIIKDTPGKSYGADRQVINYNAGQNGLASKRKDPFHRPEQHRFLIPGMVVIPPVTTAVAVRLANLQYGKRNDDVKDLQKALKIDRDGYYGPVTDQAVRIHQQKMGLNPDPKGKSYIGPRQAQALGLSII